MIKLLTKLGPVEVDENRVLEDFVNGPLASDRSLGDRLKLSKYVASPAPLGLNSAIGFKDLMRLEAVWGEKKDKR